MKTDAKDTFQTIQQVYTAAEFWYGATDRDSLCLAENRLMRGERPTYAEKDI